MSKFRAWFHEHRKKTKTVASSISLTDQAAAKHTDLNVIVSQFRITGQAPGNTLQPMVGADLSQVPEDLRGFIEQSRKLAEHRKELPVQLQNLPIEDLLGMTGEQFKAILTPPKEAAKEEPQT